MVRKMGNKSKFIKLIILSTLIFIGLNMGHPVTPKFLENANISDRFFGILFSTMAFMLVIFSPFWGNKGDNYGRNKIVAIGVFGYGIGQVLFGISGNIYLVLFGRAVAGIFAAAIIANNTAAFSEISNDKTRTRNLTTVTVLGIFAASIGYFAGGKIGVMLTPANAIIIQGIYDVILAVVIIIVYPKTTIIAKERRSFIENISHLKDIDTHVMYLLISITFWSLARNNVSKFLDSYLNGQGFNSAEIGEYVMITGIVSGLAALIIVPILAKRFKLRKLLISSLIAMIISLLFTLLSPKLELALYGPFLIYVISSVVYVSVEQTFISKNTKTNYGTIIGVRESFRSIGLVTGPLIVTALFKNVTINVFYFNLAIYVLALLLLIIFVRKSLRND